MGAILPPVLTSGLGIHTPTGTRDTPEKVRNAASQFESLLVGEMLKSMHEDGEEGWLGTGDDQTASSAMQLADEYLAQAISRHGGLGLSRLISSQLLPKSSSPATTSAEDPAGTPRTDR